MNLKINHLAKKFQDDGFVIVKNFLEKSAVDELEREINRYILKILPTVPKIHVVYESGWSGPLKQFSRIELYDRYFKKILNRPATLKLLEACLGEPEVPRLIKQKQKLMKNTRKRFSVTLELFKILGFRLLEE